MDTKYYDDLYELASCIKKTYSAGRQEQIEAIQILQQMSLDPVRFINSILNLVSVESHLNDRITVNLKKTSLAILTTFLDSMTNEVMEKREIISNILLDHIFSGRFSFIMNLTLQGIFETFFSKKYSDEYTQNMILLVNEKLEHGNFDDIRGAIHILKSIVDSCGLSEQTGAELFKCLSKGLGISGDRLMQEIIAELMSLLKDPDHFQEERMSEKANIVKLYVKIILELTHVLNKTKPSPYTDMILSEENLLEVFKKCLMFVLPTDSQISKCQFSTSGLLQLDEILNSTKNLVILFFNINLQSIQSDTDSELSTNTKYKFIMNDIFHTIGESIINFCKSGLIELESSLDDQNDLNECVITSLRFLANFARNKQASSFLIKQRNELIDVCLVLMRTSKAEIRYFTQEPEEFLTLAEDTCLDQVCNYIKSQAAKFLRVICEEIDGALTHLVTTLLNILEFSLASDNLKSNPEEFRFLTDCENSIFFTKTSKEIRIETCLLTLACISDLIQARPDLIEAIEKVFCKRLSVFLEVHVTTLVLSRICFFIGFLLPFLFNAEEYAECYQAYLEFFVQRAGRQEQKLSCIEKQANVCLSLLFESKEGPNHKLSFHVQKILVQLSSYISSSKIKEFFQLLLEIFKSYKDKIETDLVLMLEIVRLLAERAVAEYKLILVNHKHSTTILRLIWKNINYVAASKELALNYQAQIEGYLDPLVASLETTNDVLFRDDVLMFVAKNIKIRRGVTDFVWNTAKLILSNLPRNPGKNHCLGEALSQLIIYGKEKIEQDVEMTHFLLDLGKKLVSMASRDEISRATLIFGLVIEYINISDELLNKILVCCLDKLKVIQERSLSAKLLGVFLYAFYKDFEATQNVLTSRDAGTFIIEGLLQNHLELINNLHDRKILLSGLSTFFSQDILHPWMTSYLPRILSLLAFLLKLVEIDEQMKIEEEKCKKIQTDDEDFSHKLMSLDSHFASICYQKEQIYNRLKDLSNLNIENPVLIEGCALEENMEENKKEDSEDLNDEDQMSEDLESEDQEHEDLEDEDQEREDQEREDQESEESEDSILNSISEEGANRLSNELEREIVKIDEFVCFRNAINKFKETFPETWNLIYNPLSEELKGLLKEILESQRVPMDEVQNNSPVRRIVKPMRGKLAK